MVTLTAIVSSAAAGYLTACERAMTYFGVESSTARMDSAMAVLVDISAPAMPDNGRAAS
ncbi:hypothetical protein [Nocardia sp. NPDC004860]|uniref:hypothetical protein n=1 Tax=Nocardia sp. NPDC004860 TaxID=3154557 RepID=UPI0033A6E27C